MSGLKQAIRERAHELGFDLCRFASATPPDHAPKYEQWLAQGRHGEMSYLARNAPKRSDPQLVLGGARTVVCVAASYFARLEVAPATGGSPTGIVARYAQHADYHDVLGERLKALTESITEICGAGTRSLWYVDTGPILERDFAQRAGVGFVGKHTNLISRQLGNWLLLAEILTTAEIEPDAPETNRCGSCSRCLSACPTMAITAPFQLDARLCISYLTIELKGSIPIELRPLIGNRIFGCDDCLAVCPWNRFAREGELMKRQRRTDLGLLDLVELLGLDEAAFKLQFGGTPIARAKRRGLLRNVCTALGNLADKRALAPLARACSDIEPLVAEHAHWAIQQIEARQAED